MSVATPPLPEEPAAPAPATERHDPYQALRARDYRRFAGGFVCSSLGLQMMTTAVLWEVYTRSAGEDAALALGYTGLARALPVVLLALPAGHLVDSMDRKRLVVATQVGFAVNVAAMCAASAAVAPLWVFYVLLFLSGCVRSLNGPSRNALLPQLVPPDAFESAVKWTTGLFQFSAVVGPVLAGLLIDLTGRAWPVYAVVTCLAGTFALLALGLRPRPNQRTSKGMSVSSLLAGVGYLRREQTVLGALLLDLFAVLLGSATVLIPVYVAEVLRLPEESRGVAQGVLRSSLYVGALLMAVVLAYLPPFKRAGRTLLLCVAMFGVFTVGFGLSRSFWLSVAFLMMAGAADQVSVVIRHVLVQVRTPEDLRGRVGAVNSLFIECSNELGAFESGLVAHWITPVASVVLGGAGTVVVVGVLALTLPALRTLGRLKGVDPPG